MTRAAARGLELRAPALTKRCDRPAGTSGISEDLNALRQFVHGCDERLSGLPAPLLRCGSQREEADAIKLSASAERRRFIHAHAETVYDALTGRMTQELRVDELVARATAQFEGLLPTPDQMASERSRPLAEREGFEIDQGIFLQAILRATRAGRHLVTSMLRPTPRGSGLASRLCSGAVTLESLKIERRGCAAYVTMNNPASLNAEDVGLINDLEDVIDAVAMDPDIHVGVLRGGEMSHPKYAGKRVFCSGINLRAFSRGEIPLVEYLITRELGPLNKLRHGVLDGQYSHAADAIQKPWLAVVEGFAIGGGMQMLLNFDRVIAASDSYFSLPAANEGIIPGFANLRLGSFSGGRLVRQIILFGRKIQAADPEASLFCDEVVPPEEMEDAISAAVASLARSAVPANRRMINLAEEPMSLVQAYVAEFAYQQAVRMYARDVVASTEPHSDAS